MRITMNVNSIFDIDGIGDTEIDEFELALDEEEIGGFEVGVNDVVGMDGGDTGEHFLPIISREWDV